MIKTYEDFAKEAQEYKNILLRYRDTGEVFTDPNFHPNTEIKETRYTFRPKLHIWERIDKYYKAPLFKPEAIDSNFIKQGELGDCYFLSALSRLARQPDLVQSLFDEQSNLILGDEKDSVNLKCGAVVIYFHAFGRETPVLIDTLIPFKRGTRTPRFSNPTDLNVSPWFCLVEKAYAKLNGSYSAIDGGTLPGAIYSLFGYFPDIKWVQELKQTRKLRKMTPFDRLMKYQHQGAVMGAAIHLQFLPKTITEEDLLDLGLITGHSYVIMKVRKEKDINFICLRNPWGGHEWLGDWSDTSELWTDDLKAALGMQESEDGSFWMSDSDFLNYFVKVDISKPIPNEFHSKIVFMQLTPGPHDGQQISSPKANIANRTNYAIEITEPIRKNEKCKLYIVVERRHQAIDPETKQVIKPSTYTVIILNTGGKKITPDIFNHTNDGRIMTTPQDLLGMKQHVCANRHIYTIFIQRNQPSKYTEDCYIQVFCKYEFRIYDIDNPTEVVPDAQTFGIAFDNYSMYHPEVAPKLKKKKSGRHIIHSIDTKPDDYVPPPSKENSDDNSDDEEEEIHVSKEELDRAKAKAEEEAKAKEKAEEEAKAAMEEINRLKAKMKEMEDKIAQNQKKLEEESDKSKQTELENELELDRTLLETSRINFRVKKNKVNHLRQKVIKKKIEQHEADAYQTHLLDSLKYSKAQKIKIKVPKPIKKVVIPEEAPYYPEDDEKEEEKVSKKEVLLSTDSDDDKEAKASKKTKKVSTSSGSDSDDSDKKGKSSKKTKKVSTSSGSDSDDSDKKGKATKGSTKKSSLLSDSDDDDKDVKKESIILVSTSSASSDSDDEKPAKGKVTKKLDDDDDDDDDSPPAEPEKPAKPVKPAEPEKPAKPEKPAEKPKKQTKRSTNLKRFRPKTLPMQNT